MNRAWISDCSHTCRVQVTLSMCPAWILQLVVHIRSEIGWCPGTKKNTILSIPMLAEIKLRKQASQNPLSQLNEYLILLLPTVQTDPSLTKSCLLTVHDISKSRCTVSSPAQGTGVFHTSWWRVQEQNGWCEILSPSSGSWFREKSGWLLWDSDSCGLLPVMVKQPSHCSLHHHSACIWPQVCCTKSLSAWVLQSITVFTDQLKNKLKKEWELYPNQSVSLCVLRDSASSHCHVLSCSVPSSFFPIPNINVKNPKIGM